MKQQKPLRGIDRVYVGILLVIFGGIVLHAPLTVLLGTVFPTLDLLIKSWKELLMIIAGILVLIILKRRKKLGLLRDPLLVVILAYAALHFLLLPFLWQGLSASLAGLAIDLRYVAFFALVYLALKLYPDRQRLFIKIGIIGALVVALFGVLQVTVLPNDVLKYLGYNQSTIVPYLTVDKNPDFVRINSTLRGPNPLGAYAVIVIVTIAAYLLRNKLSKSNRVQFIAGVLAASSLVCLWVSYSRSALIAAVVGLLVVGAVTVGRRVKPQVWIAICIILAALAGGLIAARATPFISNVLLHENLDGGSSINSNEGHISSLQTATNEVVTHPLGVGVGSTGSASLYGSKPEIIENQFLFVAHEVGWLGLLLFALIWLGVLTRLWQYRRDWLALGIFASGIGMVVIGLLLPVWVDDTVSIIWWGLAAIALARGGGDD